MPITDAERKLFQILYNYFGSHHHMPEWNTLKRSMAGRSKEQIILLIDALEKANYLKWENEDPSTIAMLKFPNSKTQKVDGQRYFKEY